MKLFLLILQIVTTIGLIGLIMLQTSKGGLGSTFGGGEAFRTRRGAEKIVFSATIVVCALFLASSIANLLL